MNVSDALRIPGVPLPFHWTGAALPTSQVGNALSISTGPQTDWFVDPATGKVTKTGSALLGVAPHAEFTLTARVSVDFTDSFDAGAFVIHIGPERWAKLAFEMSSSHQPTVVSVVTQGRSDDANAMPVEPDAVWLRVSRSGEAFAFHASADRTLWHFVRHFYLGPESCQVGFLTQSPVGQGCRARFSEIAYMNVGPSNVRATADTTTYEYVVEHDMAAPVERVWRAWTDPAEYVRWFVGSPDAVVLDVRPGGLWSVAWEAGNDQEPERVSGRYLDLHPPQLLVMETDLNSGATVMEMTFRPHGGGTRAGVRQRCRSAEERDGGREGSLMLLRACAGFVAGNPR